MNASHLDLLARFVAETQAARIPQAAIDQAKLALIDWVGVTVAGSREPVSKIVAQRVARTSRGNATVIAGGESVSAADAALANATAGHALDFDDSSFVLGGHPTVTLLPALLAIAEEHGCSGRAVLEAYVIGFEVTMKFSRAVNFEHYEKGWHPTATLGVFGTAAGVARLLHLPATVVAHALAMAASMASGIKANFGSMTKPYQVGQASQKGVLCAQLAADGLTANAAALEGRQGYLDVYNGAGHYRTAELSNFGDTLEILRSGLMFKKYPCCGATHAPIDAALDLLREFAPRREDIESVTIAMNQRRVTHVNRPSVTSGLEGKFSVQYTIAAALTDGAISLRHFHETSVARADLQNMTARVKAVGVECGNSLSQACELKVMFKDGTTRSVRRDDAEGREAGAYPRYMKEKFLDCAGQVFERDDAEKLFEKVSSFERDDSIAEFMRQIVCVTD